jgi:flagellar motility protein MotE (MotC chaperone)
LKSIRLLPVVIFAALALLVFKGIGLVTNGGYVLTGPTAVVAQEHEAAAPDAGEPAPSEATMADANPTIDDTSPTLATKPETAAADKAPSDAGSSAEAHVAESSSPSSSASGPGEPPSPSSAVSSSAEQAAAATACPDTGAEPKPVAEAAGHDLTANIGNAMATACPSAEPPTNEHGDALPTTRDASGKLIPLRTAEGDDSAPALLQRLAERRAELDKREADLAMRTTLLDAAEKKLDERTKQLEALQNQVAALVDQKQAAEDAGFKGIVSMYEQMKPKDAAKIFDTLKLNVLLKIARAMNPRKVSPILAAMSAEPAQALTTALAMIETPTNTASATSGENLAALPQIVGH